MSVQMNDLEKALKEVIAGSESKKKRKFVETVDVVVNLKNVNLKDPNKRFNNEVELPNPVDETTTVCFFVDGDQLVQAGNLKANAMGKDAMDAMGKKEKAEKRKFVNKYEYFVANTEMMKLVAKYFGKLFGPKGKMPRPQPQGFGVINPGEFCDDGNIGTVTGRDTNGDLMTATDRHQLDIQYRPALQIQADGSDTARVGDIVTLTLVVTNDTINGDGSAVVRISVTDTLLSDIQYVGGDNGDGLLLPGESWWFDGHHQVLPTDPILLTGRSTAVGYDRDGDLVNASCIRHLHVEWDTYLTFLPALLNR